MPEHPSGTVTFLFTDVEGSTRLWQEHPQGMGAAIARHDALLQTAVDAQGGYVFKSMGDAICAAFASAGGAASAAVAAQRALAAEPWGETGPLRVRMALHSGEAEIRAGDYFGPPLNRVARLLAAGHGGLILLSQTTHELVRGALPKGVFPWDLGEHRLRDLLEPERVYQLIVPDLESDFPPLRTLDARPNNLPLQPTPLVGREREVAATVAALRRPEVRLLTLTGPGGTGKTRLALQAAADLSEDFADGVFFVALANVTDPNALPAAVAEVLGVREEGTRPVQERLIDELAPKHVLLLLDNFEQLATAAPVVTTWLAAAPHLKLMVTSRVPLRLRAEHEQRVPTLGLPVRGAVTSPDQLNQYEAVRLFIARAQAVREDFTVTNENAPAVAEICHRLDGLPLAIELAAARSKLLPPQAMLARLERRLGLLTGGARDLPERQQTLRGAIAWSYDLLTPDEQALFRRLAVCAGAFGIDAAEVIAGAPGSGELGLDVLDGLGRLVDHSLLRQEEGAGGEPRFAMLATIREYGLEQLAASGEADEARQRHAAFFLALAESAASAFQRLEHQTWLERFEADHDDLRAALEWALGREPETALRLAGALTDFWFVRGHLSEGRAWLERALAGGPTASLALRSRALRGVSRFAFSQGAYAEARDLGLAALELAREVGDERLLTDTLNSAAIGGMNSGEFEWADRFFSEALELSRRLGDEFGEARVLGNLGEVARHRGDLETAEARYEEALNIQRRTGWGQNAAYNLLNLGLLSRQRENATGACQRYKEVLALAHSLEDRETVAYALAGLAGVAGEGGDFQRAARLLGAAEALLEKIGAALEHSERELADADTVAARRALGEQRFAVAFKAGRALTWEAAVAEALATVESPVAGGADTGGESG